MDLREIARRAKVSTATVSRAINHVSTVNPQLAKRVWKVVDELGYFPNTQARALVSGRSRILGLIISEITNPFFPEIVQTFEHLAVENNYEILLTSTVNDPKRMEQSVRRMIERRVEGVAILTFGMEESLHEHLRFRKVPLVFVDVDNAGSTGSDVHEDQGYLSEPILTFGMEESLLEHLRFRKVPLVFVVVGPGAPGIVNIRINYLNGIRQAVQHLAALRHTRIEFVAGPPRLKSALARTEAFKASMAEIGLLPEVIVTGDHTMEGGMRALVELLGARDQPTAVVCSNDMTAIGVMREAYDHGITIPNDLSIVGFDDIRLAQFMTPPLTTVQMSQKELAQIAFRALLDEVGRESRSTQKSEYELITSLILRRSTAMARPLNDAHREQ